MQAAEKARQRRSRVVQILNVPQRVRLGPSLAAAALGNRFEHPAATSPAHPEAAKTAFVPKEAPFRRLLSCIVQILNLHADLPGCPARKSEGECHPVA